MFKYTIDELNKLGNKDPKYGQRYWGKAIEEDLPLMFNSMEDIELTDSPIQITAEERAEKQSDKGNNYYQLKKVKVVDSNEEVPGSKKASESLDTQESIARSVALKAAVDFSAIGDRKAAELDREEVLELANTFLSWLQGGDTSQSEPKRDWTSLGKEEDKDDIPFN